MNEAIAMGIALALAMVCGIVVTVSYTNLMEQRADCTRTGAKFCAIVFKDQ